MEISPEPVEDEDYRVLTRLYTDEDDEVHPIKIRVARASIPDHAEVSSTLRSSGHTEHDVEIAGVAVSWYLWDRLESWQARMFVFYNADLIQFFTAGRFLRTSTRPTLDRPTEPARVYEHSHSR